MERFIIPANARTWVDVSAGSDFPIQNLPFVTGQRKDRSAEEGLFVGVAIGDYILDFQPILDSELTSYIPLGTELAAFRQEEFAENIRAFDAFFSPTVYDLRELRSFAFELLRFDRVFIRDHEAMQQALIPQSGVWLDPPGALRAFVDFYSGIHHASNVGKMFRPDQPPLLPNYKHLPIGYNGRASSVVTSGENIVRPNGQLKPADGPPIFGPTRELDFELEMGFFVGEEVSLGSKVGIEDAESMINGLVIVNDWSARDIQRWEYQPLGPFLAKSFATSISPFLVSLDALEPFRVQGMTQDPAPLEYLRTKGPCHYDIQLEVSLQTEKMSEEQVICRSNMSYLYWSMTQQLAHQLSNGTPIEPGDLYASGTISGPEEDQFGSMLELSWRGTKPLVMKETGEQRSFIEDGDTVVMRAWGEKDGVRIGFGEVRSTIEPAL
ncbi:MAG: fumarylacetoacetase [Chthonomonas sp.]|nr:fumarylacetoacetase [Chthonomonas sp.]